MPAIPSQLNLSLRMRSTGDNGHWLQHHRDDEHHLGIVTRRAGRNAPVVQSYYADYMPNVFHPAFTDLQDAARHITQQEVAKVLRQWPLTTALESIAAPASGHSAPQCSINPSDTATQFCVLVLGWHELCNVHVFLGRKALAAMKKEKQPAVWLQQQLASRAGSTP